MKRVFIHWFTSMFVAFSSKTLLVDYVLYPSWYPLFDSLWPALLAIIIASYPLIEEQANSHGHKFFFGYQINHWKAQIGRTLIGLALCCCYHVFYFNWVKIALLLAYGACWFGIQFNFQLNYYRNKDRFYLGDDQGVKSALLDRIFGRWKYGGQLLFWLEVIGMALFGWAYVA